MAFSYSPKIITDGLVLYLDAANPYSYVSGSTAWNDISRGGNNGTLVNGPTFSSSNNGSIVFDGVDDYVEKLNPTSFPINSDLSVFSFFKRTGINTEPHQTIISTGYSSWNLLLLNQTTLTFNQAFIKTIISGSTLLVNQWYYAGCTRSGNEFKLYLNGTLNSTVTDTVSFTNNSKYNIGVDSNNNNFRNSYFKGDIPIVQIYNRALSSDEVLQNYNATKGRFGLT